MNTAQDDSDWHAPISSVAPLTVALWQLARRIQAGAEHDTLAGSGLALPDYVVLHLIRAHPDMRVMDVGRQAAVAKATLSDILAKLARRGLIGRHRPPADQRTVILRCTPAGAAVIARIDADMIVADAVRLRADRDLVALCETVRARITELDTSA